MRFLLAPGYTFKNAANFTGKRNFHYSMRYYASRHALMASAHPFKWHWSTRDDETIDDYIWISQFHRAEDDTTAAPTCYNSPCALLWRLDKTPTPHALILHTGHFRDIADGALYSSRKSRHIDMGFSLWFTEAYSFWVFYHVLCNFISKSKDFILPSL